MTESHELPGIGVIALDHSHASETSATWCWRKVEGVACVVVPPTQDEVNIAGRIMAHAEANYEKGFDWIVECKSINDIVEDLRSEAGGDEAKLNSLYGCVTDVHNDRIADARNSAF